MDKLNVIVSLLTEEIHSDRHKIHNSSQINFKFYAYSIWAKEMLLTRLVELAYSDPWDVINSFILEMEEYKRFDKTGMFHVANFVGYRICDKVRELEKETL